ncbi:MAG: efflux RND transporter periplasmic adaptor subunit [Bacillota bacterium]
MKKKIIIPIVIVLLIVTAGGVYWFINTGGEDNFQLQPERITTVATRDLQQTVTSSGELIPQAEKTHRPNQSGEIAEIPVEAGEQVETGELLFALDDTEQQLNYIQAEKAYEQTLIEGTERDVQEQERRLELAEEQLEDTEIRSSLKGTVGNFDLEVGDSIDPSVPGITVRDESTYLAALDLSEIDAPQVEEGQEAWVEVDALPGERFAGEVTWIHTNTETDNGSVVVPVEIRLDKSDERFRSGYSVEGEIIIATRGDVPAVPLTSIYEEEGQEYVVQIIENEPEAAAVETGLSDGTYVEITSGINPDQEILLNAAQYIDFGEIEEITGPPPGTPAGPDQPGGDPSGGDGGD